jgi:chorismate synthase
MSTIGKLLQVTTYGESHGLSLGCIIQGFPSNFPLNLSLAQFHMSRRKPGQSQISTARSECDEISVQSGLQNGLTLGTPICLLVRNLDTRPEDYAFRAVPRPGHADFTYQAKYGVHSDSGGGRASARETAARVAAGAFCLQYLESKAVFITAWVQSINSVVLNHFQWFRREEVENKGLLHINGEEVNIRCPDKETAGEMFRVIKEAKENGNSLGGVIRCWIKGMDFGEGAGVEWRSEIGYAVMSIPSVKGFRIVGVEEGFCFDLAFKPVSTIKIPQHTCDWDGVETVLECKGRHDPCVLPRAVAIVEAMAAIAIMDQYLQLIAAGRIEH